MKKLLITICLLVFCISGCLTPEEQAYLTKEREKQQTMSIEQLRIGMSQRDLVKVWPRTYNKTKYVGEYGVHETWTYGYSDRGIILSFENYRLVSWYKY